MDFIQLPFILVSMALNYSRISELARSHSYLVTFHLADPFVLNDL